MKGFTFLLPDDYREKLKKIAIREKRSIGNLILIAIEKFLKEETKND